MKLNCARIQRLLFSFIFLLFLCSLSSADVKLPKIFGNKMVLQRDMKVSIWGWATPNEKIKIEIAGQTKTTVADKDGNWTLKLDPVVAGGPHKLIVTGNNKVEYSDILFGEVWICSGQSNMSFILNSANNAKEEIAKADYPEIRYMNIPCTSISEPQKDLELPVWKECSPKMAAQMSAVGYFFVRKIHQELKVPVGLINDSWGGASCEAWINPKVLAANPDFSPVLDPERIKKVGPQQRAGYLYNGMICPIKPYTIRGVVWYQGEANAGRAVQYETLFPAMIQNWREEWGQGDFSFYYVQLANFMKRQEKPTASAWAELREAQTRTMALRGTGEAVIIDIGEEKDIHPKNKQDVGARLAAWALAKDYGKEVVYSGPRFHCLKIDDNKAMVSFDSMGSGLVVKGDTLKGFAVAGADQVFYWADAKLEGDRIVLSSAQVAHPVAVRYAWADNPECNLYNKEGFPATPFRTDLWTRVTQGKR